MKRLTAILLALILVLGAASCAGKPGPGSSETSETAGVTDRENETAASSDTAGGEETTAETEPETEAVPETEPETEAAPETEPETEAPAETEPPHAHTVAVKKGTPASCTEEGLTDGTYCSECGEELEKQQSIPPTGHSYVKKTVRPTMTSKGYDEYVCSKCKDSYRTNETPMLETVYSETQLSNMGLGFKLDSREDSTLCDGVTLSKMQFTDDSGVKHIAFAVIASPDAVSLELVFPDGADKVNGLSPVINQMASARDKLGYDIVAAINADLFTGKLPNGTTILNGTLIHRDDIGYQGFAQMNDGTYRFENNAKAFEGIASDIRFACGGRYLVLEKGRVYDNGTGDPFCTVHHPRTAFGVKVDGTMIFLVVDGRQAGYSDGATLLDLSSIFARLGAYNAICLDGGGSTGLYLPDGNGGFGAVNKPSEKNRSVVNTLMFVKKK